MPSTLNHAPITKTKFHVARQARFGRAPRIQPPVSVIQPTRVARRRSDIEKAFEDNFTRSAHLQRYRAVRESIMQLGDVHERVCRNYVTYSDTSGNQFAVIKPLSDGGLRVGVGDFDKIDEAPLDPASGLGSSARVNRQFELESYEVIAGRQLGYLRRAFLAAEAVVA